ncbi:MAG TPA: tRNA epoxyqueuosine(34) reductase QueG, partial [Candidatus Acidoferrales bacterium]|nr:tRNA epoxyqueuosine(34) reductase QueG [Candidatus Acidoferrales bacterium]
MTPSEKTAWVVAQARALGLDLCGVAPLADFPELAHLEDWLARGYAGEMHYLHDARRRSPAAALHGSREDASAGGSGALATGSIVVCAMNYNTAQPYSTECATEFVGADPRVRPASARADAHSPGVAPRGWISRYAWGDDYHDVLGEKIDQLLAAMRQQFGNDFGARAYVDTGPVVERVAAKHAGLGWLAKNTCLINEQLGSWLFLGVILTTLELAHSLAPDELPSADLCGQCRLCIDACPTGAIVEPYVLDARRCISYLTIELRGSIPEEFRAPMGRMVFGCDICQDVCPWNRKAAVTSRAAFQPRESASVAPAFRPAMGETRNSKHETQSDFADVGAQHAAPDRSAHNSLFAPELEWLASLSEEEFREIFRGSAVKRTKWRGLVRNACIALGNFVSSNSSTSSTSSPLSNSSTSRILSLLARLAATADAVISDAALWAAGRM